jgi:hypothetical protein
MPAAPAIKQAIRIKAAAFGEKPPFRSDDLDEGSMLYNDENN